MKDEETRVITQQEETMTKKVGNTEKAAYAVGGFAAGVASGVAGSVAATNSNNPEEVLAAAEVQEEVVEEPVEAVQQQTSTTTHTTTTGTVETPQPAPSPEEVLLATDEGVRIAQVNDDASFSQAFADARAQVGPGGAFEWRGHVYSTYYEEEWNGMSASERAEYQSKIDYKTVAGEPTAATHTPVEEQPIPANAEMVDEQQTADNESIRVLGVEAVVDPQGNPMTVAAIEIEGEQALLVDVDNNGMMDVIIVDENHDREISENEIYDVSNTGISAADLQQHMAASQDPNMLMASNDGMPDYMNDADVSSMA